MSSGTQTLERILAFSAPLRRVGHALERAWQWTTSGAPILTQIQRPSALVMPMLFVGAVGIGVAILPGEQERIAALERDGQPARALMLLEARYARGDRSSTTLFNLQRLYDFFGDTDKGRAALELLASQRPRDPVIQRQLAQLYKATQDEPAYVRALQAQLALRYSEPACRELIGLFRRNSDYEAEQVTLKTCRAQGYRRPDDLVRLAFLEMADERMSDVAQIMLSVDDRRRLATGRERMLLFVSLLETKRPEEASRRAVRWLRAQLDEDLATDFIYKLVEANRNDLALQLATAVSKPGDAVALSVAEVMVDQEQFGAARAYLSGWLQQNKRLDLELAIRFVTAALDAEEPALALTGAEKYGLEKLDQPDLGRLGETLMALGQGVALDRVVPHLKPETITANPMLGAALELRVGHAEQARALLLRVRVDQLNERRIGYFSRLVDQAGRSPALVAVLREPRTAQAIAGTTARPQVIGPAQLQARQRILARADANKKLRERRRVEAVKKSTSPPSAGGFTFTPFPFPQQP